MGYEKGEFSRVEKTELEGESIPTSSEFSINCDSGVAEDEDEICQRDEAMSLPNSVKFRTSLR